MSYPVCSQPVLKPPDASISGVMGDARDAGPGYACALQRGPLTAEEAGRELLGPVGPSLSPSQCLRYDADSADHAPCRWRCESASIRRSRDLRARQEALRQ